MPVSETYREAERIMTICNACRYCEGHCAVFPAMALRLEFGEGDLAYLANLCHGCQSCYHNCQYADPHPFDVNVPRTFAALRRETYAENCWPRFLNAAFDRNGFWTAAVLLLGLAGFFFGIVLIGGVSSLGQAHENRFYGVMPHSVMAGIFTAVAAFVLLALVMGIANFWRSMRLPPAGGKGGLAIFPALKNALSLKYLDGGGGDGCTYPDDRPSLARRRYHHLTFYGFLLCFAATLAGTFYHYVLDAPAPYAFNSLPKLLGISGGIGLLIGPLGLFWLKSISVPATADPQSRPIDTAFLVMLFLTSATGLGLMLVSGGTMVAPALILHLASVLGLFLTLPYGKFVHGFYRIAALLVYAMERRSDRALAGRSERGAAGG